MPSAKRNSKGEPTGAPRAAHAVAAITPRQVSIDHAKTHLSELIRAVEEGETVVIARGATAVAQLTPIHPPKKRRFGRYKGQFEIGPEFFEPLPDDELRAWGED